MNARRGSAQHGADRPRHRPARSKPICNDLYGKGTSQYREKVFFITVANMESSSEEEFLVVSAICADVEQQERKKNQVKRRKHRFWVHDIFKKRKEYGEFHHLFPDLLKDDAKFFQYFRMSQHKFFELLNKLRYSKKYTPFREPVSCEERLALTLK